MGRAEARDYASKHGRSSVRGNDFTRRPRALAAALPRQGWHVPPVFIMHRWAATQTSRLLPVKQSDKFNFGSPVRLPPPPNRTQQNSSSGAVVYGLRIRCCDRSETRPSMASALKDCKGVQPSFHGGKAHAVGTMVTSIYVDISAPVPPPCDTRATLAWWTPVDDGPMTTTTKRPAASSVLLKGGSSASTELLRSNSCSSRRRSTKPPESAARLRDLAGLPPPRALLTATQHRARVMPTTVAAVWCITASCRSQRAVAESSLVGVVRSLSRSNLLLADIWKNPK